MHRQIKAARGTSRDMTMTKGAPMTRFLLAMTALLATPATAHVGHLGEAAGHDHWIAGIAIGVAIGVSIWGLAKGKKPTEEASEEEPEDDEEKETA